MCTFSLVLQMTPKRCTKTYLNHVIDIIYGLVGLPILTRSAMVFFACQSHQINLQLSTKNCSSEGGDVEWSFYGDIFTLISSNILCGGSRISNTFFDALSNCTVRAFLSIRTHLCISNVRL